MAGDAAQGKALAEMRLHIMDGFLDQGAGSGASRVPRRQIVRRFGQKQMQRGAGQQVAALDGGRILVDGSDYRQRSQIWLHSALGYVLQTPHLFSGTIRDNIRYGNLDATDEEIRKAAELVGADRFIKKLEQGYDSEVGEGGSLLSTGQKQLLSFARAILADPRIFVLDEATSSIDTETEQEIQSAIETLLGSRTSFVVAHRLSTIRNADRILVIDGGRILEQGSHGELMALRGRYYELYMGHRTQDQIQQSIQAMA